ncbi:MAG: glycosyl hydrolase [Calditrichaeota bacterium]|nr:glycosyl hydrolase [Calditrichota bacterium]
MMFAFLWAIAALVPPPTLAAKPTSAKDVPPAFFQDLKWRSIGPYRGGRSIAVAGHPDLLYTYYFGATGGGLWKTEDGGISWFPVSDSAFATASVGAVAVAPSDPNVIYVGMGEACIRGNISPGDGIYKSTDEGKTWQHMGLTNTQTIAKIRVHPRDANIVYVAAMGHIFGRNPERGVYRSLDGGKTWEKILYRNDRTGAVDIALDPNNPRIIYAALWEANRTPWGMTSGGPGSGLFKSTDGGDTWTEITRNKGLPEGIIGKIGIAVSPAQSDLVYAIVEAKAGGVFRSEDGGKTWVRTSDDMNLRQRAFYYSHIFADPKVPETVYVLNVRFHKSTDGGKTFKTIPVPHVDNHDLWIDPDNPKRMINANDGGANVTYDGGKSWTSQKYPTGQFYHVTVDNQFPYRIYGAQQDNTTVSIASRTIGAGIGEKDWYAVGGGESGYIAVHPEDPNIVFAGSYGGYLTRYDHRSGQSKVISVWPENPMGAPAGDLKYRFQWTFPIIISPHNPDVLYVAGNHVFRSTDQGMSWEVISPDLTRNDPEKQGPSGGPITRDNTSVEYYCTIFALAESPLQEGLLWAGSDDGLVHLSRDGGKTWENVTPKNLPEWSLISIIEPSHFDPGTAYIAATRYKLDDFQPYILKTTDYGKTWKRITRGIPSNEYTRVVREDPNRQGLLYAGTERGVYVSFDDGANWHSLQLNLPHTPIHDIAVQAREKDLVVATHGRGFWVLDDLTPLHQFSSEIARKPVHLFQPRHAYRMPGWRMRRAPRHLGENPPNGVLIHYYFKEKPDTTARLQILDASGQVIKTFRPEVPKKPAKASRKSGKKEKDTFPIKAGLNRFVWDMRYPDAVELPGAIIWAGTLRGPRAVPGQYQVRLIVAGDTLTESFEIRKDPRVQATQADFQAQFDLLIQIRDRISDAHRAVITIRTIRDQINGFLKNIKGHPARQKIKPEADSLLARLSRIENEIVQTKIKSIQDALNHPIKLNNKLASLASMVGRADAAPTRQDYAVFEELSQRLQIQLDRLQKVLETEVPRFNQLVQSQEVPVVYPGAAAP